MAKILLVEDDNNLREIYEARLQAEGYTIVSARDGEEALVIAKSERPDLVISDVMMPKISGFEMLDILRNTDGLQHVKVIMLTALGQSEDQKRADSLGADRYLVKSQVTLEDIVNVSHELLVAAGAVEGDAPAAPEPAQAAPEPVAVAAVTPEPPAEPVVPPMPVPEPATTVIPVAAPPQTDPAAAPVVTPESVDEPVTAQPEPVDQPSADSAMPSAQEEATVQEQIESFVADQPGTAPAAVEPAPAPATTSPEQEQALTDALTNLSGSAETPAPAPANAAAEDAADESTSTHKKIIQPLSDPEPNKKSLQELLAEEEARETGVVAPPATVPAPETPAPAPVEPAAPPAPQTTPVPPAPIPAPKPAPSSDDFDPNSIAL